MSKAKHGKLIFIPCDLYESLKESKEQNKQSMNQEIIDRLASTFSETPTPWRELI